jgi:hypothetical protein
MYDDDLARAFLQAALVLEKTQLPKRVTNA